MSPIGHCVADFGSKSNPLYIYIACCETRRLFRVQNATW
jgi:hypothetical protein